MFFYEFCKISRNTFFIEHLWATASGSRRRLAIKSKWLTLDSSVSKPLVPSWRSSLNASEKSSYWRSSTSWASALFTNRSVSSAVACCDIPLNRKMAPANDWFFFLFEFCGTREQLAWGFSQLTCVNIWKMLHGFLLGLKKTKGWKTETVLTRCCMYWIFPLLVKFFRSQFWIIILYSHLFRLYLQSIDIIKDIKFRSHLAT